MVRHLRRPMEASVLAPLGKEEHESLELLQAHHNAANRADFYAKLNDYLDKSTLAIKPRRQNSVRGPLVSCFWNQVPPRPKITANRKSFAIASLAHL